VVLSVEFASCQHSGTRVLRWFLDFCKLCALLTLSTKYIPYSRGNMLPFPFSNYYFSPSGGRPRSSPALPSASPSQTYLLHLLLKLFPLRIFFHSLFALVFHSLSLFIFGSKIFLINFTLHVAIISSSSVFLFGALAP